MGGTLLKASDKCPDGKCPDGGHLAASALLVLMHINELWQNMGRSPTKDIISAATAQMCFFFVTKYLILVPPADVPNNIRQPEEQKHDAEFFQLTKPCQSYHKLSELPFS